MWGAEQRDLAGVKGRRWIRVQAKKVLDVDLGVEEDALGVQVGYVMVGGGSHVGDFDDPALRVPCL